MSLIILHLGYCLHGLQFPLNSPDAAVISQIAARMFCPVLATVQQYHKTRRESRGVFVRTRSKFTYASLFNRLHLFCSKVRLFFKANSTRFNSLSNPEIILRPGYYLCVFKLLLVQHYKLFSLFQGVHAASDPAVG